MGDAMYNNSLPKKLKHYKLKEFIGNGTYGYVFRAINEQNGQSVVTKIATSQDIQKDCSSLKNEAHYLKFLHHENIVQLIDDTIFPDQNEEKNPPQHLALILEECVCDLKQVMFHSSMTVKAIKTVMTQLFQGLEYLQLRKVIHCDVKPSNILLSSDGILKLCDFGFARPEGFFDKKPGYNKRFSPPETLLAAKTLNCNVDAWSAGCILVELFKKNALFLMENDTVDDNLEAIFKLCGSYKKMTWDELFAFCDQSKRKLCTAFKPMILPSTLEVFIDDPLARILICRLLMIDPRQRWTCRKALSSFYIRSHPFPLPDLMPLVERFLNASDSTSNSSGQSSDSDDYNIDSVTFFDDCDISSSDEGT